MLFLWLVICLTRSVMPGTKCWCLLSWGGRVDHGHKIGRPRSDLLADHHDVHTSQEEPVVVAVGPAHRVDARVPVQHVAVVADPVQVLENSQGRRSATTKGVAGINTLQHNSVRPVGLWDMWASAGDYCDRLTRRFARCASDHWQVTTSRSILESLGILWGQTY